MKTNDSAISKETMYYFKMYGKCLAMPLWQLNSQSETGKKYSEGDMKSDPPFLLQYGYKERWRIMGGDEISERGGGSEGMRMWNVCFI